MQAWSKPHAPASTFLITVKTLTGRIFDLDVTQATTVQGAKLLIAQSEGIPTHMQRLIYCGKQLEDGRTMSDYNLKAGAQLHLVLRLSSARDQASPTPELLDVSMENVDDGQFGFPMHFKMAPGIDHGQCDIGVVVNWLDVKRGWFLGTICKKHSDGTYDIDTNNWDGDFSTDGLLETRVPRQQIRVAKSTGHLSAEAHRHIESLTGIAQDSQIIVWGAVGEDRGSRYSAGPIL
jgi:hypothetical protein